MPPTDDHRRPTAVRATYDRIAADFDRTRTRAWPAVERFLASAPSGAWTLDLGCGNGRHADIVPARCDAVVAIDASRAMLDQARERVTRTGVHFIQADARSVPTLADTFDLAVYIATLHHLADVDARVGSLDELARVLAPDARGLISVWAVDHDRFDATAGFDTIVDWTLPDGTTVPRFYHIYDREEFVDELSASVLAVDRVWTERGNLYATVSPPRK